MHWTSEKDELPDIIDIDQISDKYKGTFFKFAVKEIAKLNPLTREFGPSGTLDLTENLRRKRVKQISNTLGNLVLIQDSSKFFNILFSQGPGFLLLSSSNPGFEALQS